MAFTKVQRTRAKIVRTANLKMRQRLARKTNLKVSDFLPDRIAATLAAHKIVLSPRYQHALVLKTKPAAKAVEQLIPAAAIAPIQPRVAPVKAQHVAQDPLALIAQLIIAVAKELEK